MQKRLWFILLALLLWQSFAAARVQVDFIDVGQGDAILIRTSAGAAALIDGGTESAGIKAVVPFLREHGVEELDLMIMTHPHADHIGGLVPVLQNVTVKAVYADGQVHTSQLYEELLLLIERLEIPFYLARAGMEIALPGIDCLLVLNPSEPLFNDLNNNSVVLWMRAEGVSFLFTGDIENQAELRLVNQFSDGLIANILKVPHHGSNTSSSWELIEAVNPETVVIMVGEDNKYGHPSREVMIRYKNRGTAIYQTDIHGTVTVVVENGTYSVSTHKSGVAFDYRINLNEATLEQLQTVPGIGPILAQRIIDYRNEVGFSSVSDLIHVTGIGEKTLEKIKDYFYVD